MHEVTTFGAVPRKRLRQLAAVCHETRAEAETALLTFRRRENSRLRALEDGEASAPARFERLRFEDLAAAVVDVATPAFDVEPIAIRHMEGDRVVDLRMDDHKERENAAIRAQMSQANDHGPVEAWGARVMKDGQLHQQIFVGPLSALQRLVPDDYTRERLEQAGVLGLEATAKASQGGERYGALPAGGLLAAEETESQRIPQEPGPMWDPRGRAVDY